MCIRDSHETLGICPYQLMYTRPPPPREITELITFPEQPPEEINLLRIYNRVHHQADLRKRRQEKKGIPKITYENGEKILIKNRQPPSSTEAVSYTHLDVYKRQVLIAKHEFYFSLCFKLSSFLSSHYISWVQFPSAP